MNEIARNDDGAVVALTDGGSWTVQEQLFIDAMAAYVGYRGALKHGPYRAMAIKRLGMRESQARGLELREDFHTAVLLRCRVYAAQSLPPGLAKIAKNARAGDLPSYKFILEFTGKASAPSETEVSRTVTLPDGRTLTEREIKRLPEGELNAMLTDAERQVAATIVSPPDPAEAAVSAERALPPPGPPHPGVEAPAE